MLVVFLIPQISLAASFSGSGRTCIGSFCFGGSVSSNGGSGGSGGGWDVGSVSGYGLPSGSISGIIRGILSWLLAIFGFLGIIGFVIAGIMYVLSAGNDTMVEKAKTAMTWSAVGIVVGLIGFVIIQAIDIALNMGGNF